MELNSGRYVHTATAVEVNVRNAFADHRSRGDFLILSEADQVYIQINGEADGPFTLEYREGDAAHHYTCEREVSRAEAEAAFLKYLKHDPSWKTAFVWKKPQSKPWWKFW